MRVCMRPAAMRVLCFSALLLAFCGVLVYADCPDRDVRCRIAKAESQVQVSSSGCEAGAAVDAGFTGDVPSGSVNINGKCYNAYKDTDGSVYAPIGVMSSGTCYQYQFGDISICQSCRPCRPLTDQCAEKVDGCKSCSQQCNKQYTVQGGDSCWQVANDNGMTLEALQGLNPSVDCENLQPNQQLCLAQGQGSCTNLCEGKYVTDC